MLEVSGGGGGATLRIHGANDTAAFLGRVKDGLSLRRIHQRVLTPVANETLQHIRDATPKGFTGETRRKWLKKDVAEGVIEVANRPEANEPPVMFFLEEGTQAHGPVRAKRLFIPLTKKAFNAYRFRAARAGAWKGLKWGVDFVLAKWVRGIRPMKIAALERDLVVLRLDEKAKEYLREITQ